MILDNGDYLFLIEKYNSLKFRKKEVEKRLKMIDPDISLEILKVNNPDLSFF